MTRFPGILLVALLAFSGSALAESRVIRVMTFNTWGSGGNDGTGVEATLAAIRAARPDVVGLQEVRAESPECTATVCPAFGPSAADRIAEALGFHVYEAPEDAPLNWANATISRYPIIDSSPAGAVMIDFEGASLALINVHFTDYPYQPYQAAEIAYEDAPFLSSPDALREAARSARGFQVSLLESALRFADDARLTIITGDFNEPSHRDWTVKAAEMGRHPYAVAYPSVMAMENLGFVDAWRAARPDEIAFPGFTWTPVAALDDPQEHHDRIDYILVRGKDVRVSDAWVVGESPLHADIVVTPWPSDHRAVIAEIEIDGR